jgi:hypothetical protein
VSKKTHKNGFSYFPWDFSYLVLPDFPHSNLAGFGTRLANSAVEAGNGICSEIGFENPTMVTARSLLRPDLLLSR